MSGTAIVGGGIVGLATAWRLLEREPGANVLVLEKEAGVCRHQTGNNSGVLHAGLYYKPGSAKARLAVRGIRQMVEFCREHAIAHEVCGKLVVATDDDELARLRNLHERGRQNGLEGLELLDRDRMREIEPHAAGVAALRVPQEGIVDYPAVCDALVRDIETRGGRVVLNAGVRGMKESTGGWILETTAGEFEAGFVVNCAGLHSDRVAALAGTPREVRIIPFRGEYYKIRPERQFLVRNLIYPVPDPKFPFLGVHFTRLIHGGIEAGPNAVLAFAREGYRKTNVNLYDLYDTLSYPGIWRFLFRYPRMCWEELRRSFSRRLFCASLQKLVPEIREGDLITGRRGSARAGHRDHRRPGTGFPLRRRAQRAARAERPQSRGYRVAGHRGGDRGGDEAVSDAAPAAVAAAKTRYLSLDAFRGFIMLALVSAGFGFPALRDHGYAAVAAWFDHVPWEGGLFWDFIQPAFIFMVGVAMPFALARRMEQGEKFARLFRHVAARSLRLLLLSEIIMCIERNRLHLQLTNVLAQIAFAYFFCFLIMQLGLRAQAAVAAGILAAHWALFAIFPGPQGPFSQVGNIGDVIDRAMLGWANPGHYASINALTSTVTALAGVWTGMLFRSRTSDARRMGILAGAAAACFAGAALLRALGNPVVKRLWTSSWTLYSTAWVLLAMLAFYWVIEVKGFRRWTFPFVVVGMNSIFIYTAHEFLGGWVDRSLAVFTGGFHFLGTAAPVAQACAVLLVMWYVCFWLYRRGVFFKL